MQAITLRHRRLSRQPGELADEARRTISLADRQLNRSATRTSKSTPSTINTTTPSATNAPVDTFIKLRVLL
jgi:hypothetical protein